MSERLRSPGESNPAATPEQMWDALYCQIAAKEHITFDQAKNRFGAWLERFSDEGWAALMTDLKDEIAEIRRRHIQ